MTTTQRALHDQVRQKLNKRDALNKLNGAISSASAATGVMEFDTSSIAQGMRLSIDMEDLHVWSKVDGTKTVTWERGVNSTTAATHLDDSLVRVGATYSPYEIGQAINDELDALPGDGLFAFDDVEWTYSSSRSGYNLTSVTAFEGGHRVYWLDTGSTGRWVPVHQSLWSVEPNQNTSDFASGIALMLRDPDIRSGSRLRLVYKKPFTALNLTTAGLAEAVETISGADSWVVPVLAVGAAIRLQLGLSSARADLAAQGNTRRADEVSTSDTRLAATPLQIERRQALSRARREQTRKYGV